MRVEQEQSDLGRVEISRLRDSREWRRLIGPCATLRGRHNMASLTPSLGKPQTIAGIGSKCRGGRHNHTKYQALGEIRGEPRWSAQSAARKLGRFGRS